MNHWFERLTEQMALAKDDASVKATLQNVTCQAGFCVFAYLNLQAETQTVISTYSNEWQGRYFEKNYALIDPVVLAAKSRPAPFVWSNVPTSRMSKERREFYGEAAEFGIRSGVSIPIKTGFGRMAILTLASSQANVANENGLDPIMAAAAFGQVHCRIEALRLQPTRQTDIRMKPSELTCLRWAAEGKSMKAVAVLENTTYSNVAFFIKNAKEALGVSTLPQATALAKELGLI